MEQEKFGVCHICGQEKLLTFEHLPPKKANNNNRAKAIVGDELTKHIAGNNKPWDFTGHRYKNMQKGMGVKSICKECNNNTGANYADEYIKFANVIGYVINHKIKEENVEKFTVQLKDIYTLRIVKQIYAMYASTLPELYIKNRPDLQKFILDKDFNDVDFSKYRLSIFAIKEGFNSWSGIMSLYTDAGVQTVATMNLYPLGFVLEFDPVGECKNTDITYIGKNLKYDTKQDLELTLYLRNTNSLYPFDYRTKSKIEEDMITNKKKTIEFYQKLLKENNIDLKESNEYMEKYNNNEIILCELSNRIYELIDKNTNKYDV